MAPRDRAGLPWPKLGRAVGAAGGKTAGGPAPRGGAPPPWDQVTERRIRTAECAALENTIAQLREANQNLVLATLDAQSMRDDAEAANRRQNEFLAMLPHELRNPLAPISVAAAMIGQAPGATPQLRRLQAIIGRQVGHLSRLLDDLLDAARISNGKITLLRHPIRLADVIERAVETIQPHLSVRRQLLSVAAPAQALDIDGDHVRLTQVFSNLLANASKFTPDHGHIRIRATPLGRHVEVTVGDDGAGIAADVLPHVFDLFTQGPRSLARSEGGLGVGLSIVRDIVQMHGGTVTASSPGLGGGSVFSVTLPLLGAAAAGHAAAVPAAAAMCPARRILLVDDNADACAALQMLLEMDAHSVDVAHDGAHALAAAGRRAYDVIICDIGMPGMDGLEFARALRASAGGKALLLLGLSGYGQPKDRAGAAAAGFDAYFVKPVDVAGLTAAMAARA
ncbi:hybrid sensor histidine kinase/response regulator [Janthinobacterium sp.]|uniref:hybrid sensor histidine kinase/response regulator n=1 Tax=Janthinobacterium sp. TaxID=1871054 RepID=UPI00293D6F95|nr:hybrid sensor histidine kinase/response regulator [Janthinobacterium sp.]